jgi:hypothetical protein
MNAAVMIGAALVAVGAIAASAIKGRPQAGRVETPTSSRLSRRLRLLLVRAAGGCFEDRR